MKMGVLLVGAAILFAGCSSQKQSAAAAPSIAPLALVTPQSGASKAAPTVAPTALVTPQGGASEAARAAGAESRNATIPKVRDVPASGVTSAPAKTPGAEPRKVIVASASPTARVTPQSGASEAARAAGAESRNVIIPKIRDVPASGVTSTAGTVYADGSLPPGVPYASNTDPVRIVSLEISSNVFHPGDDITGDVVTTSNAASVTAQVGTMRVSVPRVAPGKFHLNLHLPDIPLPPGAQDLVIRAIRTDGTVATRSVTITVER